MSDLDDFFNEAIDGIEKVKDENKLEKIIDRALDVVRQEKNHQFESKNINEKINKLQKIVELYNIKKLDSIAYVKANIYFEHLSINEPSYLDKAEKIYKSLISKEDVSPRIKDLSKFALCRYYSQIVNFDDINLSTEEKQKKESFKKYFSELDEKKQHTRLDNYIAENYTFYYRLYLKCIEKNERYIVENINNEVDRRYSDLNIAIEESIKSSDILIDFCNFKTYIKGNYIYLSKNKIKYLYLLSEGTTNEEVISKIGFSKKGSIYHVTRHIKDELAKYNINIEDKPDRNNNNASIKEYYINPSVNFKIIRDIAKEIDEYLE